MASRFKHVLVAYQDDARTCEAVADALCGTVGSGASSVSPIKGPWREGDGIDWDGHQRLGRWAEGRGRDWEQPSGLIDSLLDVAIAEDAIPGARVVVAHHGHIVLDKSVGTLDGTAPVVPGSIYDLASITKVVATANALMRLCLRVSRSRLAHVSSDAQPRHPGNGHARCVNLPPTRPD